MSINQKYALGVIHNSDKISIRLMSTVFIDLNLFETIKSNRRAFNVFQWKNNITGGDGKIYSGWVPWLHYSQNRWTKFDKEPNPEKLVGGPLMTSNKFFKSLSDFRIWLGEDEFRILLTDLL